MSQRPTLYLIDGHALLYKAYHAMGPLTTKSGEPTGALFGFLQIFKRLTTTNKPSHLAIVLDPAGPTFRSDIYPAYKANRPPQPPELTRQLDRLEEVLALMRTPVVRRAGFEADDLIATLAKWAVEQGRDAVIVSVDKDLYQCIRPGVTMLREHLGKIEIVDDAGVHERMGVRPDQIADYLALLGDTSDNIPGVAGIGKKRAAELLAEFGTLEALLAAAVGRTKPKFWESLANGAEAARLSRRLATVKDDVPLDPQWDSFAWQPVVTPELRDLFLKLEFRTLVDDMGGVPVAERRVAYETIRTADQLSRVVGALRASGMASIDTETTGFDPFADSLVGISLSWAENQACYIPIATPDRDEGLALEVVVAGLGPLLAPGSGVRWCAHNWRFDYKMLRQAGFPVGPIDNDTLIAAFLIDSDRPSNALKQLAVAELGIQMTEIGELIGPADDLVSMASMAAVPVEKVSEYACQDADVTRQLAERFAPRIADGQLDGVLRAIELPLTPVLARMELAGVRIDRPWFAELGAKSRARLDELTREIHGLAGRPFNINSTKQLAEILFEELKLPKGKKTQNGFSTDVTVLEELAPLHDLPARLLEYRQLEKLRGTYIEALPALVNRKTGLLHTSFNQTIAATGRLSSSDPNLQNIPVRTEAGRQIRRGFIPRTAGWKMLAADYSQIELRILAHLSGDTALGEAFRQGGDIHTLTASRIFSLPMESVSKEQRTQAKALNFGIIYGMTAFRLARDFNVPIKTAEQFIADYFAVYSGVRAWIDATLDECRRDGFVRTMGGRRRFIPDIRSTNGQVRSQAERVATNTPIQGTSADMIKIAMIRIDERLRREGRRALMTLQVHDELIFDVPEDEIDAVRALVVEEMAAAMPLAVPIQVDAEVGDHWDQV